MKNYSKLHILADFDGTLTKPYDSTGKRIPGIIAHIKNHNLLGEQQQKEAQQMFEKYRPIEHDPLLSLEEKIPHMETRWKAVNTILINNNLNLSHINFIATSGLVEFRDGREDFFNFLQTHDIPLTIYSASGIGTPVISQFLAYKNIDTTTINIVSNDYIWDEQGFATGIKGRVMHTYNKESFQLNDYDWYTETLAKRNNALIVGDSLGDITIGKTAPFDKVKTVGFINKKQPDQDSLDAYQKAYDHLLQRNDGFKEIIHYLQTQFAQ